MEILFSRQPLPISENECEYIHVNKEDKNNMMLYCVVSEKRGDTFDKYFFCYENAKEYVKREYDYLSLYDERQTRITLIAYKITLDFCFFSADEFVNMLFLGERSISEYDSLIGFKDSSIVFVDEIK